MSWDFLVTDLAAAADGDLAAGTSRTGVLLTGVFLASGDGLDDLDDVGSFFALEARLGAHLVARLVATVSVPDVLVSDLLGLAGLGWGRFILGSFATAAGR